MSHNSNIFIPFNIGSSPSPTSTTFQPRAQINAHTTNFNTTLAARSSTAWCYNTHLGFIHEDQGVCPPCDDYVQHVTQSSLDSTFQNACNQREQFFEKLSSTAFDRGRLSQYEEDTVEINRLRNVIDDINNAHDNILHKYRVLLDDFERLKVQCPSATSSSLQTSVGPQIRTPPRSYAAVTTAQAASSSKKFPVAHQPSTTPRSPFHRDRLSPPTSPEELGDPAVRLNNPRITDPIEMWFNYYCTYKKSWPKGLRKTNDDRPHWPDLRAIIATTRMRPKDKGPRASPAFYSHLFDLFSVAGLYERLVKENGFTIARIVSPREFLFPPQADDESPTCTIEDIARHFASCGFGFRVVAEDFEPWAKAYRDSRPKNALM